MSRYSVRKETRERMRDTARRHPVNIADICRKASALYKKVNQQTPGGVNLEKYKVPCTRDNRVVVTAANCEETGEPMEALVNWYLDQKDNGQTSRVPHQMKPEDCKPNPDGSFTYTGGAAPGLNTTQKEG